MSVRKIARGKWWIDYYPLGRKGKRERKVFYGSEQEAKLYEAELRQTNTGEVKLKINPKVVDIVTDFKEWLEDERSATYARDFSYAWNRLEKVFGHVQFSRITPSLIDKYKKSRKGKKASINKELSYLQSLIKFAVKKQYAKPLPFLIEKPSYKAPPPMVPNDSDVQKFIDAIVRDKERKTALVLLLYQSGLRVHEALGIKWEDINWEEEIIFLKTSKGGESVIVDMTVRVKELLLVIRKEEGFVFVNRSTGKPWKSVKTLFRDAAKRAGIKKINPHLLRHAFGTNFQRVNKDLRLTQSAMRHKDIASTMIYLHTSRDKVREGVRKTADHTSQR